MGDHYYEIVMDKEDGTKEIVRYPEYESVEKFLKERFGRCYPLFCYDDKYHYISERKEGAMPVVGFFPTQAIA